jgi:hypothetical protein
MGSTYETDSIEKGDRVALTVQAAVLVKYAGNLVACQSWLVARLALAELRKHIDELAKTIEAGSK